MEPRLEYDRAADAAYIRLRDLPYARGEDLDQDRRIDYAADGGPIGVELLEVSAGVNLDGLPQQEVVASLLRTLRFEIVSPAGSAKEEVIRQFGGSAAAYASSPGHARGDDLAMLIDMLDLQPDMTALDIATGAGHTAAALAPHVRSVVAVDLTPEMIEQARALAASRGLDNVEARVMDAEALDLPDQSFDVVTARIAPHHFLDIRRAVREMARVLRPGGRLGLEDSCAPADPALDRFINHVDWLHDRTHVRSYTQAEWEGMLREAGLEVTATTLYRKRHTLKEWIERSRLDAAGEKELYAAFAAASEAAREYFDIEYEDGKAVRFSDEKLLLRAEKG